MHFKVVLVDLSGTLHVEDEPTYNAVQALEKLRKTGVAIKFITNTTKESRSSLHKRLIKMSFVLDEDEIYSSLTATAKYVQNNMLNPFYLLSRDARIEFPPQSHSVEHDSVVVGLAPSELSYENLNKAFNILITNKNHRLIAIHRGKFYKTGDGLALGPGFFVSGLESSVGIQAELIGKPKPSFFMNAIPEHISPAECVMIGDDPSDDVIGAVNVGMHAILVKTGKYLPQAFVPPSTTVVENFDAAVNWIMQHIGI